LSLVSVVVFFVLPTAFLSGDSSLIGSVVLGLLLSILVGFALLAVSALPWVERPILRMLQVFLGPAVELGARNLSRYRRRNNTTALMFILSVALVVFVSSLVALFSRTALNMVEHFNGADLRLQSDDPEAGDLREDLSGLAGVTEVSVVRGLKSRSSQGRAYDVVLSDLVGLKHVWLVPFGVDGSLPRVLFTNHLRFATGGSEGLIQVANYTRDPAVAEEEDETPPVVVSQAAARFLDVRVGDRVQLTFYLGAERRAGRFRVAAVCATLPGFAEFRSRVAHAIGSGVLLPATSFNALTQGVPNDARFVRYLVKTEGDRATQQAVAAEIRDRYDLRFRFGVKSVGEQQAEARAVYWTTQVLFGLLVAVAVTIAVFALIASMASSVMERRWEVGMLKALGLRRGQLFRMFVSEALGVSLASGVTGGAIGFLLAWLFVVQGGALAEIPVVVALPYVTFTATWVVCTAAGVVAAYLPTRRLLRGSATEILRMTG
jgi:putative ABC transport system permease protein